MNDTQREVYTLVRDGIRSVDVVFARLASDVAAIMRDMPIPLTHDGRRAILRRLDRVLDRVFGLTQRTALVSDLFRTIVAATDSAAERPFLRLLRRVEHEVSVRDTRLWQRIRIRLLAGGRGPDDRFATIYRAFEYVDTAGRRIVPMSVEAQRIVRAGTLDPQRRWVSGSRYRLSDRVWRSGRDVRRAIDDRLRLAIRRGDDPIAVARDLERYLNPEWQPLRMRDGKIVVDHRRKQVYTMRPRGGHGSNAARRLVRTEVMRAHAAATMEAARITPGAIGLAWRVSGSHPAADVCDEKAQRSSRGMGPGEYTFAEFPRVPSHPNCLCVAVPVMLSRDALIDQLVHQYGGGS